MAEFVHSGGDPQVGNLSTPVNGSGFTKAYINALPAYRKGLSANRRGLEIGMAHGYFLYGPFALLGPIRYTEFGPTAGLLATIGLVAILTICLSIYGTVTVEKPTATLTTPVVPEDLGSREGWSEFASGFLLGGCGGAFFAYFLCQTPYVVPLMDILSKTGAS